MDEEKTFIRTREWLIVILYATLVGTITLITQFLVPLSEPEGGDLHTLTRNTLDASVSGGVAKPGIYCLPKGATIGDLLAEAELLPEADLSKIRLASRLTQGRHIKVPMVQKVSVRIEGEVEEPVTVTVVKGTKVKDLISCITVTSDGDVEGLKKQRALRDGETIVIKRKKHCKKT